MDMDTRMKLELLNQKLEREGLTDNEKTEAAMIRSAALRQYADTIQQSMERLDQLLGGIKK